MKYDSTLSINWRSQFSFFFEKAIAGLVEEYSGVLAKSLSPG